MVNSTLSANFILIIMFHTMYAFCILNTTLPMDSYGATIAVFENNTDAKLILLNGFYTDSVYSIDLKLLLMNNTNNNHAWYSLNSYPDMNIPFTAQNVTYYAQTSTYLNNIIYGVPIYDIIGGESRVISDKLFAFDLVSNQYINQEEYTFQLMENTMFSCIVSSSFRNTLYIMGGNAGSFMQLRTLQIYDITNDEWYIYNDKLPSGTASAGCSTNLQQDIIYYFGGDANPNVNDPKPKSDIIQKYDITNNSFTIVSDTSFRAPRSDMRCILISGAHIYCIGGRGTNDVILSSVEIFDISAEKILNISIDLHIGRTSPMVAKYDNYLLVLGGYNDDEYILDIEVIEVIEVITTTDTPLSIPSYNPTVTEREIALQTETIAPIDDIITSVFISTKPSLKITISISATLFFIIIVLGFIDGLLLCICVFYIFNQLLNHIAEPGNIYWMEFLQRLYWVEYIGIILELADIVTDYIFAADLIVNSIDAIDLVMFGWISLIIAVFGAILFYLKWFLVKKLYGHQIYNLNKTLKSASRYTQQQRLEIVYEIRLRQMDVDIISLLNACVEDLPQTIIVLIILSNGEWGYISTLCITMSLLSFLARFVHVLMSKCGCNDFNHEVDIENSNDDIQIIEGCSTQNIQQ